MRIKRAGARAIDQPCDEPEGPSRWGRRESTLRSSSAVEKISFQHSDLSQFRKPLQLWMNFEIARSDFPIRKRTLSDRYRSILLG